MIFPIRCVTCNNIIGGKYLKYLELVKTIRSKQGKKDDDEMEYLSATTKKTAEGLALDELNIVKVCCRRHFLTHVDLV